MFTKIDKKVLIIGAAFLILLLLGGFFVYKYLTQIRTEAGNVNDGVNTNNENTTPGIEINGENEGGLFICSDKCGDGICQQTAEEECDNLNCTCKEDKQECPQDCK